jgi:hypothetical protein
MTAPISYLRTLHLAMVALLCLQVLTACAKGGVASVNIHGVNYTDREFSYRVEDPSNPKNHGGGELVDAYSAGGTLCCYELPRTWRPGIKLQVHTIRWKDKLDEDVRVPREEIRQAHVVEVPEYKGKPGELWVLLQADGRVAVVSSDVQPDHPDWPGATKGWPVPSVEFMRKQADMYIEDAESSLRATRESLAELEVSPARMAREVWRQRQELIAPYAKRLDANLPSRTNAQDDAKKYRDQLSKFTGPEDPGFIELLKSEDRYFIDFYQKKVDRLKKERP